MNNKLSKQDFIWRLDELLNIIEEDYYLLWEGNPSLICKYGANAVICPPVDSSRQLLMDRSLESINNIGFKSIGIIRKDNKFNFYLDPFKSDLISIIANAELTYNRLEKQMNMNTKSVIDKWALSIHTEIGQILGMNMICNLAELRNKLEI